MTKRFRSRRPSSSRRWPLALQTSRAPARSLEQRRLLSIEPLEERRLLTVHDLTTSTDYATIQAAVNGANPGDTLLADAATYAENVTVNKPLTIEGAQHGVDARTRSGAESIVTGVGNNGDTPFYITANDVTIDGFTVEGATNSNQFGFGILEGGGTSGTQILNNIVQDNIAGLSLANATGGNPGLIQHNLFQNNNQTGPVSGDGIYSDQFNAAGTLTNVTIDANSFSGQSDAGIDFSSTDATKPATAITISNNVFDSNARGMLAFNLTSSTITGNTFSNSTSNATADIRLFEGVDGLAITNNLLENGAGRAVRISNIGTGSPDATNISFNYNSVSGYTGPAGIFQVDNYTGTLDASRNWWGDISGPTIASNAGGLGQTIVDPGNQVTYRPWLIYSTDADLAAPGFQLPLTVPVASLGDPSAAVNDFTLLQNAIGAAATGQTIDLSGGFNWTATNPNANAAYGASTSTAPTADIRGIALPDGVNNLTITTSTTSTITGVGDSNDGIYNSFLFAAANPPFALGNSQLTVSNLNIDNFKSAVTLGWNNGGTFDGTLIQNNTITVAADNDNNANDVQGIAIYFWKGQNQTITGNTIDFMGNGTRTTGTGARSYGFQDGTTGGTGYDGLSIDHNTFQLLPSALGGTEVVTGVWENGHNDDNASHIHIDDNQFLGITGRQLDIGVQLSSQTTNMSIDGNTFTDVKYVYWVGTHNGDVAGDQFTFTNNTLTRVGDANGIFLQNAIDNTPGNVITINWGTNNSVDGKTGIRGLNELSTQATEESRPAGGATDLDAVVAFGPIPADYVNATWGPQARFTNPLATPDGTPGPIAFGFNTFTTIQDGVNAVDTGGTVNVLPGTYIENVTINKNLTLTGPAVSTPTAIIDPPGTGITISPPATDVTVENLEVTGSTTGIDASGVATVNLNNLLLDANGTGLTATNITTLNLTDLTLTGNTTAGGTITNVTTVNDTPLTGSTGATDTITGSSFQRGSDQAVSYSGVTDLKVFGSGGNDTFDVTPATLAEGTTITVNGELPDPPATPGDTLNVVLAGTTTPALSDTVTATGHQGSWTFGNAMPIDYSRIETLANNTDLSISKTDNGSPAGTAVPGGSLTYTIVVTNAGSNGVTGATIDDTFPVDFSGTYTASATGGATGFTASGSGDIHDTVDLPAGSTVTYTVTGTISSAATGTLSNTATVTSPADTLDTNLANNSSTDNDTLTPQADLQITKTDNSPFPGQAVRGTTLTYTIVATNAGLSDVTGATVADTLPADFTAATYTTVATGGATDSTPSGTGNISDTVNLPAGSTITYTVTGTVALAATGTLSNTATVTAPAGVTDTNTANNSATDNDTVSSLADLSITKSDDHSGNSVTATSGTVVPGTAMTYTIVVANAGPSNATGATVSDTFPAGFIGATYTATAVGGATGFTASGSGNISDTVDLPAGSTITYVVSGTVSPSATGTLSNTATVTAPADIADSDLTNNSATDTDTLTPQADLSITKSDGQTTAVPGTSDTYTIVVANAGPSDVVGASVADTFPAIFTGTTYTATASGGATGFTASGSGNISDTVDLPSGSSITYVVTGMISASATGTLSNTAAVNAPAGVTDTNIANNSATDNDTLTAQADLSITKTDGSTTAVPGTSDTYTIVVANAGPSDVVGASVADTFPAIFTGATFTATATGGATGFTASGSNNINDTVNLPAGSTITYVVSGTISAAATGTLSNTATVTAPAGVTDTVTANNSATDSDTLTAQADLSITKTDGSTTAVPGTSDTYTIVVANAGPSDVIGASVGDAFPADLTGATFTATATGGATGFTANGSGNISDTVNLPAGSSITYVVTGTISAAATGTLSNTATVTAPAGVTDAVTANNSATDSDTLTAQADLSITKTDGSTTAVPGTGDTYTIVVTNNGPSDVIGASVGDTFPAIFAAATYTATATGGATGFTASGNGNISDTVNLPAGSTITYLVTGTISASATGTLSNTATVTAPAGVTDTNTANNSATDSDTLTAQADLSITKTDGSTTAVPGTSDTYTIVVSNAGPSDVIGASVADAFPADFTGAAYTATGTGGSTGFTASASGAISDTVNLPAGSTITYVVTGTISASATGTLSNTATVAAPAGVTDANTANNSATDSDTLTAQADLSITKTDGKTNVIAGTSDTYTIVVTNAGPSAVTGATVTDTFPADFTGATFTATATGGATGFTASGSGNLSDTVNLPVGGTITYVVTGTVSASATGNLTNTATVAAPAGVTDTITANNSATDTDSITAQAAPAITSANSANFAEGSSNTFTVTATGVPTPSLTESGTLPGGVTFVDNGDGTATLSGTPATGSHGTYTITITAHNGVSPDAVQPFTLTVSPAVIQTSPFGYLAGVPGDGTPQTFVHNLYRELLGREPDPAGLAFWTNYLQQHDNAAGRLQVIASFMNSEEYKAHYITTLYEVLLGRGPDAGGLQFWTGQMGNPGTPGGHSGSSDEKFILSEFVGSDEFYADAGGTPQGFAQALYQDLLGRTGEASGVNAWAALAQAQPNNRDGVVRLFLSTPEAEHLLLDSFYPAPGGTASHPLPAPGTAVPSGSFDLAVITGDGWENLYLEGPFDSAPQANDAFFAELAGGVAWDDVQLQLLATDQFYTNPNRPTTL